MRVVLEMTTLASVGDMPALPLGMAYPRNWTPSTPGGGKSVLDSGRGKKKKKKKRKVVYAK